MCQGKSKWKKGGGNDRHLESNKKKKVLEDTNVTNTLTADFQPPEKTET